MKKKNSMRDNVNLFFSAFLITAYIICGFFFVSFASSMANETLKNTLIAVILVVFGLIVFYATRVGEGSVVVRFSLVTLIILDLPALLIILFTIIPGMPLYEQLSESPIMSYMAAVALGYGVPYTFISGFESYIPEQEVVDETPLEGGIEEDLSDIEQEDSEEEEEDTEEEDEILFEGTADSQDTPDEDDDEPQEDAE